MERTLIYFSNATLEQVYDDQIKIAKTKTTFDTLWKWPVERLSLCL